MVLSKVLYHLFAHLFNMMLRPSLDRDNSGAFRVI